jgi:hypothetical protein
LAFGCGLIEDRAAAGTAMTSEAAMKSIRGTKPNSFNRDTICEFKDKLMIASSHLVLSLS